MDGDGGDMTGIGVKANIPVEAKAAARRQGRVRPNEGNQKEKNILNNSHPDAPWSASWPTGTGLGGSAGGACQTCTGDAEKPGIKHENMQNKNTTITLNCQPQ